MKTKKGGYQATVSKGNGKASAVYANLLKIGKWIRAL
jgi:hypothetical protein